MAGGLGAGELVPLSALTSAPQTTTVSIPVAAGAAPELKPGQTAEFWLSTKTCRGVVLLDHATLQDVRDATGSFSSSGGQDVVLSLLPDQAARVIQALALPDVQIRVGVLAGTTPAAASTGSPPLDGCEDTP